MIPITQTKVVVNDKNGEMVVRGNCYAAAIASILEKPITEVPNVEVLFHIEGSYWAEVMHTFLNSIGWELCIDDRYRVFHDENYGIGKLGIESSKRQECLKECSNKYYFVSGKSPRGIQHICIFKNGRLVHDPHPSNDGIETFDYFETLEKNQPLKTK